MDPRKPLLVPANCRTQYVACHVHRGSSRLIHCGDGPWNSGRYGTVLRRWLFDYGTARCGGRYGDPIEGYVANVCSRVGVWHSMAEVLRLATTMARWISSCGTAGLRQGGSQPVSRRETMCVSTAEALRWSRGGEHRSKGREEMPSHSGRALVVINEDTAWPELCGVLPRIKSGQGPETSLELGQPRPGLPEVHGRRRPGVQEVWRMWSSRWIRTASGREPSGSLLWCFLCPSWRTFTPGLDGLLEELLDSLGE